MPVNLFASNPDLFIDPNKDYLDELVGEGKKFSDAKELARSKAEADAHIARLEAEQAAMRQELSTRLSNEAFLEKLNTAPLGSNRQPQVDDETGQDKSAIKLEDVKNLLNEYEVEKIANANLSNVQQKLLETFGPNYAQHVRKQAGELGMGDREINSLAATNPKALYKLLGVGEKRDDNSFTAPPHTQLTTTSTNTNKFKGDSFYEDMRKKNPDEFWSAKIQNEIFETIKTVGADNFYKS